MYVFLNLLQQIIQIISTVTYSVKSVRDLKEISKMDVQIVLSFSFHVEKLFSKLYHFFLLYFGGLFSPTKAGMQLRPRLGLEMMRKSKKMSPKCMVLYSLVPGLMSDMSIKGPVFWMRA